MHFMSHFYIIWIWSTWKSKLKLRKYPRFQLYLIKIQLTHVTVTPCIAPISLNTRQIAILIFWIFFFFWHFKRRQPENIRYKHTHSHKPLSKSSYYPERRRHHALGLTREPQQQENTPLSLGYGNLVLAESEKNVIEIARL